MASIIPVKEFAERRRRLMELMAPDSIAILPAARSGSVIGMSCIRSARTATFST